MRLQRSSVLYTVETSIILYLKLQSGTKGSPARNNTVYEYAQRTGNDRLEQVLRMYFEARRTLLTTAPDAVSVHRARETYNQPLRGYFMIVRKGPSMSTANAIALGMCLLTAGLGVNHQVCAEPPNAAEPWRLACRLANYGEYQEGALEHIKSMGLRYIFMSIPKPEEVETVMEQMKMHGLEVVVVRGDTNLSKEASVAELGDQLAICKKMGVHYMFLSPKRHDAPKEIVCHRLKQAGDLAAQNDVVIVLETHPDLGTNGTIHVETMKAINHPNVRVNFDTGNITYYNANTNAAAELEKCIEYVATVEVKDHNAALESWFFPALGEGKTYFSAVFKQLRAAGYQGPITIEIEGFKDVVWTEEDRKQAMEASVAYLQSIESFK